MATIPTPIMAITPMVTIPTLMAITVTRTVIMGIGPGVQVTGVTADGVIMVIGGMVAAGTMVIAVMLTGVMVVIADNAKKRRVKYYQVIIFSGVLK